MFVVGCCEGPTCDGYDDCVFDMRSDGSWHLVSAVRCGDSLKVKFRDGSEMRLTEYKFYNDINKCPLQDRHKMISNK